MKAIKILGVVVALMALALLAFYITFIPIGWHMAVAVEKLPPATPLNFHRFAFRSISRAVVMHTSTPCRSDLRDLTTGEFLPDEHGAVSALTSLYDREPTAPIDHAALTALLSDRLKHCPADSKAARSSFTPLQEAVLLSYAEPVRLLLDAGADPTRPIDRAGKKIHGMNSLELAKHWQTSTRLSAERKEHNDRIIDMLQNKMRDRLERRPMPR